MAKIINTADLDLNEHNADETYWLYNGFDCCITREVFDTLDEMCDDVARPVYELSKALQAPVLEMNTRGMRVNQRRKYKVVQEMTAKVKQLEEQLNTIVRDGIGVTEEFNWRSPKQVKELLYDTLGLPVQKKRNTNGIYAPTSDEDALEKLGNYFLGEPVVNHLLALRGLSKSLGFLKTDIDPDGRMRTKFNIAGTNTGRFSSSGTDVGTGTNLQNVTSSLRSIFAADPNMMFCNIDLEQADSRNVGALCWNTLLDADRDRITDLLRRRSEKMKHWNPLPSGKWEGPVGKEFAGAYLDACESGDLHTIVTKMAYHDLPWGTASDREIADTLAIKHHSYRFLSKKLGHGSNYLGTPPTMAKHARLPTPIAKEFQAAYFNAFPCIPAWQQLVADDIKQFGFLTTPLGRRRFFFDRPEAGNTLREATAFQPQSMTGDEMNYGIMNLWRDGRVQLVCQVHDSVLFQFPASRRDEVVPWAIEALRVEIELKRGRKFTVPTEAETGFNWGYISEDNPDGLQTWKGSDNRKRVETDFSLSVKDL